MRNGRERALRWLARRSRATLTAAAVLSIPAGGMLAVAGEALLRARLDESTLPAATRFYARPLVLYPGAAAERDRVERTLRRLGYRPARARRVRTGEYRLYSRRWIIGQRPFRHYHRLSSGGTAMIRLSYDDRVSRVYDDHGRELRYVALEPELIQSRVDNRYEDRIPLPLSHVPQHLIAAVLAVEDRHFFEHGGVDVRRVAGAALANIRAGRIVQGASTITQQLAKNLFLSFRRSLVRKLRELAMASMLELRHSKEEILQAYLNEVYLGQNGSLAIHGVGAASQFYFGKDVSELDLAQAALLAGMIRGPNLYSPHRRPQAARERRDLVLKLMREQEVISADQYRAAQRTALRLIARPAPARLGRHFLDFVAQRLRQRHGKKATERGLSAFTTLDLELQGAAERAVERGLARLEREYPQLKNTDQRLEASLVALDPVTGEILAMVGGRNYGASQFNRAVMARRQPGSAFKPVVVLTALSRSDPDDGRWEPQFTLASRLEDAPLSVETAAGVWQPVNYDGRFRGEITLREALERSLNVPFARLGVALGPERIVATARRLGIRSPLTPVYSIALGSNEVTPLELTAAYGVMAAEGYRAEPSVTLGVLDGEGNVLERYVPRGEQVFDAAETYLVTSALRGAVERGTGRRLRSFGFRGVVAAKSGTTNDFRDAWFVGYTPRLAIGVWVGFDNGRSIGLSGSQAALPIFARFLVDAVGRSGRGNFTQPPGVEVAEVDRESGLLAGPGCRGEREVFLQRTAPSTSCSRHWKGDRDYRAWTSERSGSQRPELERRRARALRRGRN